MSDAIEKFLRNTAEGYRALAAHNGNGAVGSFAEFILRNGRAFEGRPLPKRYAMGLPRMCYFNSYQVVKRNKNLRYCEGYVALEDCSWLPLQHAWAIDDQDRVVDTTLQEIYSGDSRAGRAHYFGIVFERCHLDKSRKGSGLLNDVHGVPNFQLWFKIDPGFKALVPD
jgi:hypothetical protein